MTNPNPEQDQLAEALRNLADDTDLLAVAAQNHLIAQHDYMGQGLEFLVRPWATTLRTLADALTVSDDWHDTAGPFDTRPLPPARGREEVTPDA